VTESSWLDYASDFQRLFAPAASDRTLSLPLSRGAMPARTNCDHQWDTARTSDPIVNGSDTMAIEDPGYLSRGFFQSQGKADSTR